MNNDEYDKKMLQGLLDGIEAYSKNRMIAKVKREELNRLVCNLTNKQIRTILIALSTEELESEVEILSDVGFARQLGNMTKERIGRVIDNMSPDQIKRFVNILKDEGISRLLGNLNNDQIINLGCFLNYDERKKVLCVLTDEQINTILPNLSDNQFYLFFSSIDWVRISSLVRTMDDRQLVRLVDTFGYDSDKISMVFLNITDDRKKMLSLRIDNKRLKKSIRNMTDFENFSIYLKKMSDTDDDDEYY